MPPHVTPESPHPAHPLHRSYKSISEMLTDWRSPSRITPSRRFSPRISPAPRN